MGNQQKKMTTKLLKEDIDTSKELIDVNVSNNIVNDEILRVC